MQATRHTHTHTQNNLFRLLRRIFEWNFPARRAVTTAEDMGERKKGVWDMGYGFGCEFGFGLSGGGGGGGGGETKTGWKAGVPDIRRDEKNNTKERTGILFNHMFTCQLNLPARQLCRSNICVPLKARRVQVGLRVRVRLRARVRVKVKVRVRVRVRVRARVKLRVRVRFRLRVKVRVSVSFVTRIISWNNRSCAVVLALSLTLALTLTLSLNLILTP